MPPHHVEGKKGVSNSLRRPCDRRSTVATVVVDRGGVEQMIGSDDCSSFMKVCVKFGRL